MPKSAATASSACESAPGEPGLDEQIMDGALVAHCTDLTEPDAACGPVRTTTSPPLDGP
ncbi:hypothetical protein [Streptomyces kronopolitis]|uniref:hypothetical protein n=1 Tax=Streptomyces kronopolitis TaxID=1612435 RepID=UPI003D993CCC